MKKSRMIVLCFIVLAGIVNFAYAELSVVYVNSDRILAEYELAKEAQIQLDKEAKELEKQYRQLIAERDSLFQAYDRQKLILSEERRAEKENEITTKEQVIQRFQVEKLGPQGAIYAKQQELIGPVLEKIKMVIQEIGKREKYDYIMDTVAGNILYAEPKFDITDDVLYELQRSE